MHSRTMMLCRMVGRMLRARCLMAVRRCSLLRLVGSEVGVRVEEEVMGLDWIWIPLSLRLVGKSVTSLHISVFDGEWMYIFDSGIYHDCEYMLTYLVMFMLLKHSQFTINTLLARKYSIPCLSLNYSTRPRTTVLLRSIETSV